jgi:S1-C subfamily serine protease
MQSTSLRRALGACAGPLAVCLLLLCVLWPRRASADNPDLPELAERARRSVVLLTIKDGGGRKVGTGTGFFVSTDGRVITNHHVVEGASQIEATLFDERSVPVLGLLAADERRDIAILKLRGDGFQPLTLGTSTTARVGDEVVVLGNPVGLSGSLSTGIIAALREHGLAEIAENRRYESWAVQITAPIAPGSSGSPVMTRRGEVVAVAVGVRADTQGLNFAVPIEVAKTLLESLAPGAQPVPFADAPTPTSSTLLNLGISAAVFGAIGGLIYLAGRARSRRTAPKRPVAPKRSN